MRKVKNRWLIAASAVGIHLSIGSVYAWSVFAKPIVAQLGWGFKEVQLTFSIAILFLGLSAAFLGRFVEKHGPRKSGALAACFFGAGIAASGLAIRVENLYLLYICYGILGGIGLGVGYIAPVSTLVKWFPDRRGLATGLAIMGFGFASLIAGPIIQKLIVAVGLANTFLLLGCFYFTLMFFSSQYLAPPEPGWTPIKLPQAGPLPDEGTIKDESWQLTAGEAVKTRRFYWLWVMLFINVTCGIAVISAASPMGQEIAGLTAAQAAAMVGLIGLFNGGGRIVWATLSDYIGRANTYSAFFIIQVAAFYLLPKSSNPWLFQGLVFLAMTCYGGGFSCVPAYIGDMFGTRQLAAIHGYILTAWAAAGLAGPVFAAWVRETTGNYVGTMSVFLVLFCLALTVSLLIRLDVHQVRKLQRRPAPAPEKPAPGEMTRSFPARPDVVRPAINFITAQAEKAGLPERTVFRLQLAAEEAITNICHYAYLEESAINRVNYAYRNPDDVVVNLKDKADAFEVELIDQGGVFNPLMVASPAFGDSLENFDAKGLGIHLLRKMADEVGYRRTGNRNVLSLVMRKSAGPAAQENQDNKETAGL